MVLVFLFYLSRLERRLALTLTTTLASPSPSLAGAVDGGGSRDGVAGIPISSSLLSESKFSVFGRCFFLITLTALEILFPDLCRGECSSIRLTVKVLLSEFPLWNRIGLLHGNITELALLLEALE